MISVIVPVYNAGEYIEECIVSIQEQTLSDWELILVDNGSVDKSLALCEKRASEDSRIRVFHQEVNTGVSAARNYGMNEAKGEHITFVDADDRLKPDCLNVLSKLQRRHGADMVIGGFERWTNRENGRIKSGTDDRMDEEQDSKLALRIERGSPGQSAEDGGIGRAEQGFEKKERFPTGRDYSLPEYLEHCLLNGNTHCWGVLYEKELLDGLEFPEGMTIGEDVLFLMEAAFKAQLITVTDYSGYQYYINSQGAMEKPFTPSYMDQVLCWQRVRERITPIFPVLTVRVESILLVSVLLVVGKLAGLTPDERKKYQKEVKECQRLVKLYSGRKEIYSYLPAGYPLKVRLYRYLPGVYLLLYGRLRGNDMEKVVSF